MCIIADDPLLAVEALQADLDSAAANAGGTHMASVRHTLFGWNNETLNAWTMIIGLLITSSLWLLARWMSYPVSVCCRCICPRRCGQT